MAAVISCSGELTTNGGYPQCSGLWEATAIAPPFDPSQLDPAILAQAFSVGFSLVATFMVLPMGIRAILNFIKTS